MIGFGGLCHVPPERHWFGLEGGDWRVGEDMAIVYYVLLFRRLDLVFRAWASRVTW